MAILAAFMVPHPPMIVPNVGRGSEEQIVATTEAYKAVAAEIASLAPDTIIISSPHATMYYDYFHISPGKEATGNFGRFRAREVSFTETYDEELVKEIESLARKEGLNAGTKGEREPELDHGTMVPLYFIREVYKGGKIIRVGLSGLSYDEHYRLGQLIHKATDNLNRRAVYVASGDLSHKLQKYGPYGFVKEGPEYDAKLMEVCEKGNLKELLDFDEDFCDTAAECGHRSFIIMAGALDGYTYSAKKYSHEDVTGVGYGICSFYPVFDKDGDENENAGSSGQNVPDRSSEDLSADPYVALARKTVNSYIKDGVIPSVPENLPKEMTTDKAGAFVSIHEHGNLRGCIGTILPTTGCIAEEIIQNAVSASTRDPRFDPITEDELPDLDISVDVLMPPEEIDSKEQLDVKKYGVIVTKGFRRGLLLPDLEGVDTVEDQIAIAKMKAGIGSDERVKLQRFEVIRHH